MESNNTLRIKNVYTPFPFMKSLHACLLSALLFATLHVRLSATTLPPHPRLFVSQKDWDGLPARVEAEPAVKEIVATCISRADSVLKREPLTYKLIGRRMLSVSREVDMRVLDLTTAWKLTGDRKYLDRCRAEMLAICDFKDWHPSHHLDTAEMQTAIAIGYDWLYNDLSPEDRKTISTALLQKGLKATFKEKRLRKMDQNWNQVCNGGMTLSAIALHDIAPDIAEAAMAEASASVHNALNTGYPPDGAYAEGGSYWEYGTIYSILTIEALRSAGLPGYRIIEHPGFLESGKYYSQIFGNTGLIYSYGDGSEFPLKAGTAIAWMARENKSTSIRSQFLPAFLDINPKKTDRFLALSAFWFPSAKEVTPDEKSLHYQGAGNSPIAIHRTGFGKDDLWLGIKAGKAGVNHGHMDAGSFVLDFLGQRWANDLGAQNYNSLEQTGMSLFDRAQDSGRWTVFRLNNFSHNTLTYNGQIHQASGAAIIISSKGEPENETLLDLAPPLGLPKGATAKRRFRITSNPVTLTITDSLAGLNPGDRIDWQMMTRAKTSGAENEFLLTLGGKNLKLSLTSPQGKENSVKPADPPPADYDAKNKGMTSIKLTSIAGDDGNIEITSVFRQSD